MEQGAGIASETKSKPAKTYAIVITVIAGLVFVAFVVVFHHAGYDTKVLAKLGLIERTETINWAVRGWENCLEKLNYDSDIVFFGDSITANSDFRKYFDDKKIVNLGYSGDTLSGMIGRVPMVKAVSPEKVFLLGGINGLTDSNMSNCVKTYSELLDSLCEALPNAEIYVISILPISYSNEVSLTNICHNTTIIGMNAEIERLAENRGLYYIDLHSLYTLDGEMNPDLTTDGVHLKPDAYDRWADAIRAYID